MKKYLTYLAIAAALLPFRASGLDQDPALTGARAHLHAQELIQARDAFAAVVANDPGNEKAQAMLAITRFVALSADPRTNQLLDFWQVDSGGRDIYNWEADIIEGAELPPAGATSGQLQQFVTDVILQELMVTQMHLAQINSANFTLRLVPEDFGQTPNPYGNGDSVVVDRADILVLRAALKAVEAALRLGIASNDLNVSADAIQALVDTELLTLARLLEDNASLLSLADGQQRVQAGTALTEAIQLFNAASPLLRQSGRDDRLFVLEAEDWEAEEEFREILGRIEEAMENPIDLDENEGESFHVYLAPLFADNAVDVRALLPNFVDDKAVEGTLPDPTFAGVLPDLTAAAVEESLWRIEMLLTLRPNLLAHPRDIVVNPGESATFEIEAEAALPLSYQWTENGQIIPGANESTLTLENVDTSKAGLYAVNLWTTAGLEISRPARLLVAVPLGEALDAPELDWVNGGHGWVGQTLDSLDGVDAAETRPVDGYAPGYLDTTVQGPGSISFYWKVDRDFGWGGGFGFWINGIWHAGLQNHQGASTTGWQHQSFHLPEGLHHLRWNYDMGEGSRGWVDQVVFTGDIPPPGGFHTWAEVLPAGQRGLEDDPGGFGVPNLLRYAFALDPLQPDRSGLPTVGRTVELFHGTPMHRLTLTYTRRKGDPDLQFRPEAADTLGFWYTIYPHETIIDNGDTETVIVHDVQWMNYQSSRFLRLRVLNEPGF